MRECAAKPRFFHGGPRINIGTGPNCVQGKKPSDGDWPIADGRLFADSCPMSPDETPPLELAWYADGKTLVRVVRMLVHSDRLATSLAEATQKLAACGLPISDKFAEICRDADRWDELDEQLHALRSKTLELERRGKTDTLELNLQLFLENVAMHLWNERTKSIRFEKFAIAKFRRYVRSIPIFIRNLSVSCKRLSRAIATYAIKRALPFSATSIAF